MLSVSYKYLALGEVYLPIRAAFPNYPTLESVSYSSANPKTGLSPSMVSCSKELMASIGLLSHLIDYNSVLVDRFTSWAFTSSLAATEVIVVTFFSSAY